MENTGSVLGIADYVVFSAMLLVSAIVGVYFQFTGGRQRTTEEFILGDKKMSIAPVAFSLMASFASAIGMLGFSAENYLYGFQLAMFCCVTLISTFIIIHVYHPVFYNMKITTVFEYFDRRFGRATRILGCLLFVLNMVFYMAVALYAPALAMNAVTDISMWASILSVGIVCTFYCTIGGIKAVLWTDLIQGVIMYITLLAVIIKGCLDVGGIINVWKIAVDGGRIKIPIFNVDPTVRYTFWSILVGGIFFHLSSNAVSQIQVQRMMTLETIEKSRQAVWSSVPLKVILTLGNCFCGITLYANFAQCDPIANTEESGLNSYDQLLPYFIMKSLGQQPGLPGLCMAGLFSASLSTLSSVINSLSAVTIEDFIRPNCPAGVLTESRAAFTTKLLTLFYGVLCILLSYVVEKFGGLLETTITISGIFGGPMLGLFTLGMLFERPNQKGALTGLLVSLAFCMWISFGTRFAQVKSQRLPVSIEGCQNDMFSNKNESVTEMPESLNFKVSYSKIENISSTSIPIEDSYVFPLYKLSYMWYPVIGCLTTVIVGYIISLITGPKNYVDPIYLSPILKLGRRKDKDDVIHLLSANAESQVKSNGAITKEK